MNIRLLHILWHWHYYEWWVNDYALRLDLAWNVGHKFFICESNSLMVVDMAKNRVSSSHPCAPTIGVINKYKDFQWNLYFVHTLREDNMCMNWLANNGVSHKSSLVTLNVYPPTLNHLVLQDGIGHVLLRS